jgi:NAD(P)-dependent dehydrogenase (short-subunit alcohol dehydrogenase family)
MTRSQTLEGVALVTGGRGGLGRALDGELSARGMKVITADLPGQGGDLDVDVTDPSSVQHAVDVIVATHGRLDVVVANAGVSSAGMVEDLPKSAWEAAISVNIEGAVNVMQAAYPTLVRRGRGQLVFIASLSGLLPTPLLTPYSMSKAAIVGLARAVRPEAARHGVGVTVVCPGPIETTFLDTGGADGVVRGVDARRYLTSAAGRPMTAAEVARATVTGIEKNRALVAPGRAGLLWRLGRLSPRLAEVAIARAMREELRRAG